MEWTAENNKATINELLDYYADLLGVYRGYDGNTHQAGADAKVASRHVRIVLIVSRRSIN